MNAQRAVQFHENKRKMRMEKRCALHSSNCFKSSTVQSPVIIDFSIFSGLFFSLSAFRLLLPLESIMDEKKVEKREKFR